MAILIRATGEASQVRPKDGRRFSLDELRELVGGPVEMIADQGALGQLALLVNAEGWHRGRPRNVEARRLSGQWVFGDAVLMTRSDFGRVSAAELMAAQRKEAGDADQGDRDGPAAGVA